MRLGSLYLMADKIDAVELVAKALAGGERGFEISLAEHIGVDLAFGDNSGVARLAADQRNLAKEIARPQARDLVIGADHLDFAVGNQEELLPGVAFADDRLAAGVVTLCHFFRDVGQLARRQSL